MPGNSLLETQHTWKLSILGMSSINKITWKMGMKYLLEMLLSLTCSFKSIELILL